MDCGSRIGTSVDIPYFPFLKCFPLWYVVYKVLGQIASSPPEDGMKKTLLCMLTFALLTWLIPVGGLLLAEAPLPGAPMTGPAATPAPDEPSGTGKETSPAPDATASPEPAADTLRVLDEATGEILTVSARDYRIGAAAAELPADWPNEAIKAQMVAAWSYALFQQQTARAAGQAHDLSANPARRQGFMTREVLESYWGVDFEANYQRLAALADQVEGRVVQWEGAAAACCYHASSCGATEASQNVWTEALPYLQGVDSPWDTAADGWEVTVTYTVQQMTDALQLNFADRGLDLSGDPSGWFGAPTLTAAGYVASQPVAGAELSGIELRGALGLRSAAFTVQYADRTFSVTTHGYGHGVGLSQWGARGMALEGKSCADILAWYYPGTQLVQE